MIDDLTIGEAKQLAAMFSSKCESTKKPFPMIGKKVIIRTYSAGCWYGELAEKDGNEVIVRDARRLWYWVASEGISLSAVSLFGLKDSSKIVHPVDSIWLEAIEIIPCTDKAIKSIEAMKNVSAQ